MPRLEERGIPQLHARRQDDTRGDGVAASFKRRGKWSSSGILVVREAETAVSARRRREEPAWLLLGNGCLNVPPRR